MVLLYGINSDDVRLQNVEKWVHRLGTEIDPDPREWTKYYCHWRLSISRPVDFLAGLLVKRSISLSVAESCTGGAIADALTSVAGASSFFDGGVVTYTAHAKQVLLNIPGLLPPGCVAPQLSMQMAKGIRETLGSELGLGITGALGPSTPHPDIRVGEVYIAIVGLGTEEVAKFNFSGDRHTIKASAVAAGLNFILTYLARWNRA